MVLAMLPARGDATQSADAQTPAYRPFESSDKCRTLIEIDPPRTTPEIARVCGVTVTASAEAGFIVH